MEALILSHLAMMAAFGIVFILLRILDPDWRLPWPWAAMFFVLPVGMVITASAENLDHDGLRFAGLIGSALGPTLYFDGMMRFMGLPRPLGWMLGGGALYAALAALACFVSTDLPLRLALVVVLHMVLGVCLIALARRLNPEDHAASRRIIQILSIVVLGGLGLLLASLITGSTVIPMPGGVGTEIILAANGIAAICALTCLVQIAERMSAFIRREARTDPLTGLHARRSFDETLPQEVERSRRYGRPLSLILFDVDRFKTINDSYGHDVGDMVLQRVADCARSSLRPVDQIARLGGDEFAVLLPETDQAEAVDVGRRILGQMRSLTVLVQGHGVQVTGSFGVATLEDPADTPEALTKRADLALYAVKRAGRNNVSDRPVAMETASTPVPARMTLS